MNRRDLFKLSAAAALAPVLPAVAIAQTPTPLMKESPGGQLYVFRRWVDATTFSDLFELDDYEFRDRRAYRYAPRPGVKIVTYDGPVLGFRARQILLIQEPKTFTEFRGLCENVMLRLMPGGALIAQYPREWYYDKLFALEQEVKAGTRTRYTDHEKREQKRIFKLDSIEVEWHV